MRISDWSSDVCSSDLIRRLDAEQELYRSTVQLRGKTLDLVQRRYAEGDISELDVARAKSELASAQSESLGVARLRAVAEHALAILMGKTPAEFSIAPRPLQRVAELGRAAGRAS